MELCAKCGNPHGIGDWPLCPHGRPYGSIGRAAHPSERTVVFRHPQTGKISYPPRNDMPMDPKLQAWGYERHELPTLRDRERFEREQNVQCEANWFDAGSGHADHMPETPKIDMTGLEFGKLD